jgi:hypothetical protein
VSHLDVVEKRLRQAQSLRVGRQIGAFDQRRERRAGFVQIGRGLYNKNVKAEVLTTAVAAAVMFYLLKTYTNRFSQTEDQAEDKFKDLLMRNVRICMVDGAGIDEMYPIKRNPESGEVDQQWLNYKTEIVACALYTFCSLMRHACCPNVFVHHHGIKRVIRAVRTIPKGQELFITYG